MRNINDFESFILNHSQKNGVIVVYSSVNLFCFTHITKIYED